MHQAKQKKTKQQNNDSEEKKLITLVTIIRNGKASTVSLTIQLLSPNMYVFA